MSLLLKTNKKNSNKNLYIQKKQHKKKQKNQRKWEENQTKKLCNL